MACRCTKDNRKDNAKTVIIGCKIMDARVMEDIKTMSTAELAKLLTKQLQDYKGACLSSEETLSIPCLDFMIEVAKEMSRRLSSFP